MDMERLISKLNSHDESERLYAIHDIQEQSDINTEDKFVESLFERLKIEEVQAVRNALVDTLKMINITAHFESLFSLFSSDDAFLRNCVIEIFASNGEDAVAFLTSKLDHSNPEVRKLIIDSLVEIKSPESILAIRAALHDSAINVKITAAEYLGRLRDTESAEELIEILRTENEPMLRMAVINALLEIGDSKTFNSIITSLTQNGDINKIDPIYLSDLLRIVTHLGNKEDILNVLNSLDYKTVYAEEIATFLIDIIRRMPELKNDSKVKKMISKIKSDELVNKDLIEFIGDIE